MTKAVVIDYGIGNLGSVLNGCRRAGVEPTIVRDGKELDAADCDYIVLPGVGAIGQALRNLRERELDIALEERVRKDGIPFLAICVGMQFLAEKCEEFGEHDGLGWIPGRVTRLATADTGLKLPHVGWNDIRATTEDPLLADMDDRHFYFVHSYALHCPDEFVIARCDYGQEFVCAIRRDNIVAVQFHPEKSSANGVALLKAFFNS
jgi:imidazole glycerol-phosphate synthase subunit HisH